MPAVPSMIGKTVLVTGGTGGIGMAAAIGLASMGARVGITGRGRARAEQAAAAIVRESGNPAVDVFVADMSSQAEVRRLAREVLATYQRLDVLLNNVGGFWAHRQVTADGLEHTFALNHLAPFLRDIRDRALLRHPGPADCDAEGIRRFRGVPHRLETIADRDGVRWINDSQATIPVAAIAGLEAFAPSPIVLIAGGQGKGLDYATFADAVAQRCRAVVLIGETAAELERLIRDRIPVQGAASMEQAVTLAAAAARPGDVVLLSPAATSFDMFTDYAARGDAFREAVAQLVTTAPGGSL